MTSDDIGVASRPEIDERPGMSVEIETQGFELEAPDRDRIEKRFHELATRFGPIAPKVVLTKGSWLTVAWTAAVEMTVVGWTVTAKRTSNDSLEAVLSELFLAATGLLREVAWQRDGVDHACRWCDGEEFIFVRHPADAIGDGGGYADPMRLVRVSHGDWRGDLETLVCRGCGHVEWFVKDANTLPIDGKAIFVVKTRKPDPYRG